MLVIKNCYYSQSHMYYYVKPYLEPTALAAAFAAAAAAKILLVPLIPRSITRSAAVLTAEVVTGAAVFPELPDKVDLLPRRRGFHPFSRLNLSMSSNISFSERRTYFSSPFSRHLPVGLRKSPMKTLVLKLKCSLWRFLMPFFSRY